MTNLALQSYIDLAQKRSIQALKYAIPLALLLAAMFYLFPSIDLATSGWFYDHQLRLHQLANALSQPETDLSINTGFPLATSRFLIFVYAAVDVLSRAALIISMLLCVFFAIRKNARFLPALIVTLSLIAGPILAVNGGLKEHWGRARPRDVVQFGGTQKFTPAWVISDQCTHNCSFVTGHGAAAFAVTIGFFVSRRKAWLAGGLVFGGLIGLTRMMNGAHFLSDVTFSFFVVFIAAALVAFIVSKVWPVKQGVLNTQDTK
ncbi:MAG TPA: phosphatase PAP2 family protein [Methyloradius sp.]|nr:phosphatase PAP2 family protein [Methyloradius sp.]